MKIVLTTGGTGGHIYPAIALAKYIRDNTDDEVLFIGTTNHMEYDIVVNEGFEFFGFDIESGNAGFINKIQRGAQLASSTAKCYSKFRKERPDLVIGFGSYVTVPALLAASFLNIPIILHEQNSSLGAANKTFFKKADALISCYQSINDQLDSDKVKLLGNPRASEVALVKKDPQVLIDLGLNPNVKTILIVMGSLGSSSVNDVMFNSLQQMSVLDLQVIFVTGKKHYDVYSKNIDISNVKIVPYIDQPQVLKNVDLVIARGGATTAAEICALGTPSIIIPSPYVANNHQYINALQLEEAGAGLIIKEEDLSEESLLQRIQDVLFDDQKLSAMGNAALTLAFPNAIEDIMKLVKEYACED